MAANIRENKEMTSRTKNISGLKISRGINKVTTTQVQMARALKVSQPRVNQMVKDGTLPTDETGALLLVDGLRHYFGGRLADAEDGDIDFDKERALHEKAKREIAELQLMKMKKQAYSARTVEYVMTEMLSNLRTQLLGLPSKLAPLLEGKTKEEIYASMTKEIEEKLSELSSYSPDLFDEDVEEEDEDEDS